MRLVLLFLVSVILLSGRAEANERARAFFDMAVAENICAPWGGGQAIMVSLTHETQEYPRWMISFYRQPIVTGKWLDFSDTNSGYISFCKVCDACYPVPLAKVMVNSVENNQISGELKVQGILGGMSNFYPFGAKMIEKINMVCG